MPPCLGGLPSARRAERCASGAPNSQSEGRAEAIGRRLQAIVRQVHYPVFACAMSFFLQPVPVIFSAPAWGEFYNQTALHSGHKTCTASCHTSGRAAHPQAD
jgi:hypothetical protein